MTKGAVRMEKKRLIIRKRGQVTLPKPFMDKYNLKEGDVVELVESEDGIIKLVPMVQVPVEQKWFWTEEWQKGEREADEDIRLGRFEKTISNKSDLDEYFKGLDQ